MASDGGAGICLALAARVTVERVTTDAQVPWTDVGIGVRELSSLYAHDVAIVWPELSKDGPHLGRMP